MSVLTTLDVVCPAGVAAGDLIGIEAAGRTFEVAVPDGVEPGMRFQVQLDDDDAGGDEFGPFHGAGASSENLSPAQPQPAVPRGLTKTDASTIRSLMEALFDSDEIDDFIDDHSAAFASYSREGEQQLQWTVLHNRFCSVVEATIHDQLHDLGMDTQQLYGMLAEATGGDPRADAFLSRLLNLEDYHRFCEGMCSDTSRLKFSFCDLASLYAFELPEAPFAWEQRAAGLTWQERAAIPDSTPVLEENT